MDKKKGSIVFDSTGWWILGIIIAIVVIAIILSFKDAGSNAISGFLKILRFGK